MCEKHKKNKNLISLNCENYNLFSLTSKILGSYMRAFTVSEGLEQAMAMVVVDLVKVVAMVVGGWPKRIVLFVELQEWILPLSTSKRADYMGLEGVLDYSLAP